MFQTKRQKVLIREINIKMNIDIKIATFTDAEEIAIFSRKSFYDSFADQNTKENMEKFMLQFSVNSIVEEVKNPENIFLLAIRNDVIIGYVKLSKSEKPIKIADEKAIEIARIYIDKKMTGQGIGNMLMKYSLDLIRNQEVNIAWLGVWENNQNAIAFYKKWGFERFGEHIFMLGDDPQTDWLLKKEIT